MKKAILIITVLFICSAVTGQENASDDDGLKALLDSLKSDKNL